MRCEQAQRWFSKARDDELSDRRQRQLARDLEDCDACREEHRLFLLSCQLLHDGDLTRGIGSPPGLADSVIERLKGEAPPNRGPSIDVRVVLGIAATLALLLWGDQLHVLDELPDISGAASLGEGGLP